MAGTVFFGGGTPSLLTPDALGWILETVSQRFRLDAPEVTLEANPDDVTPELADAWRDLGVNRVSLGVQSFDDAVLRYLGRRHDARGSHAACDTVAERFANWGMDLIFGAPPFDSWLATLAACAAHEPKHVSAYGLTCEPGTPFEARRHELPDDDTWLALYRAAEEALPGFIRYEVSNLARPGFECRHNLLYWRNLEYAGFGPGAYSFLDGVRSRNAPGLDAWLANPGAKVESLRLSTNEIRVETVIQHLRLAAGLPKQAYRARFGSDVRADFGARLDTLIARGLLTEDADSLRPTPRGFELNNELGLALVDPPA